MRVAFLDSWHPSRSRGSGSAVAIRGLKAGLESLGHRVDLLRPRRSSAGRLAERIAYNLKLPLRYRARHDLVVGFDFDGLFLPRPADTPYVVSLKGVAADERRFERGIPRLRLETQALLEAWNARRADRVVVPSRYSRRQAARAYGLPERRVAVVPEGLDLREWGSEGASEGRTGSNGPGSRGAEDGGPRSARQDGPAEPVVLSVARQYPRKNTRALLLALPRLLRSVPDCRLRVVGGGPELPRLRRLAARTGISRRVAFLGEVEGTDRVRREYARADVFCLPSLQEGFGIVFLEAMAAGLPVVAYRCGAVPEVVPDGDAGVLVEPGDLPGLARAVGGLLRSPGRRRAMGRAGSREAREYDWPSVARRFLERAAPRR